MPRSKPPAPPLLLALLSLLLPACGSEGPGKAPPADPIEVVVDVQIEPTAVTLDVGETFTLAALVTTETTEPGAASPAAVTDVTWTSTSAHVATIAADGTVVALAPGSSLVTATAGGLTAEATITVRQPVEPQPIVDRVELSQTALTLAEGGAATLTATPRDASGAAIPGLAVLWSSTDERVVAVTAGGELRGVSPGAAEVRATVHGQTAAARVTVTLEIASDLFFEAWSPDTSRFNWLTRDLRDPATASRLLMAGSTVAAAPVPSPRGDLIAFTLSAPLRPQNQLRVVNLQRETLWFLELPGEVADAAWSWDGEHLAFALRSAETGFDIWAIRADGTGAVNLTGRLGPGNDTQPTWAPASAGRLAFTRDAGGQVNVWTVDADGANAAPLTSGGADADPAWSPDGGSIAFQRSGAAIFGDLFFVSPGGAVQRSLVGLPGIQGRPAWSPDGALVAFTSGGDVYTVRATDGLVARRTFDGEATVEQRPGWLQRR